MSDDQNAEMHKRSGAVHHTDALISLFYTLLRDHIQPGDLEKLVREECEHHEDVKVYSNGWLAEYARDMVHRLLSPTRGYSPPPSTPRGMVLK